MTILNQTPIMEIDPRWIEAAAALLIGAAICFVIFIFTVCIGCDGGSVTALFATVAAVLISTLIFIGAPEIETERNEYEAIIDETVPIAEVYEKYEVVEQRGDIWVLEDKEINE